MSEEFKVGDRVELVDRAGGVNNEAKVGDRGNVVAVKPGMFGSIVTVRFDGGTRDDVRYAKRFKKVATLSAEGKVPPVAELWQHDPTPIQAGEVRVTSDSGASKGSKLARYDLIPTRPLKALAEHYGRGAEKYKPVTKDGVTQDNWRFGYPLSLSYAALFRHLTQFWAGEDIDEETGSHHLSAVAWHAFTMLHFLTDPVLAEKYDDRQDPWRAQTEAEKASLREFLMFDRFIEGGEAA